MGWGAGERRAFFVCLFGFFSRPPPQSGRKAWRKKYEVKKTGKAGLLATCQTLKTTPLFCQNNTLANLI